MKNMQQDKYKPDAGDDNMNSLRRRIDEIDAQILDLINRRLAAARHIGEIKNRTGKAVIDSSRESQVYRRLASLNEGPLRNHGLYRIFRAVIAAGREIQTIDNPAGIAPLYMVIGNPIGHSLSPVMHNSALAFSGQDGHYLAFRVDDVAAAVEGIRGLGIGGASVTIPHKIAVIKHLDVVDPLAADIGAVNTVVNRDGILHGYNSDCAGAVQALSEKTAVAHKQVVVLGAGGAARAIGFGLKQKGCRVTIVNRTVSKGEKLAGDLGCRFEPLSELKKLSCHIVVNATPVGMTPDVNSTPLAPALLAPGMVVMDMVYNPLQTRFLKAAQSIGCTTVDGLSMFVHQGAVQFELWTGNKAPVDIMRQVVLEALENQ